MHDIHLIRGKTSSPLDGLTYVPGSLFALYKELKTVIGEPIMESDEGMVSHPGDEYRGKGWALHACRNASVLVDIDGDWGHSKKGGISGLLNEHIDYLAIYITPANKKLIAALDNIIEQYVVK